MKTSTIAIMMLIVVAAGGGFMLGRSYESVSVQARIAHVFEHAEQLMAHKPAMEAHPANIDEQK